MRIILLLLTLLIVGFLVKTQLDSSSLPIGYEGVTGSEGKAHPNIPSSPKDIKKFEQDINDFILDSADKRSKELEEALSK